MVPCRYDAADVAVIRSTVHVRCREDIAAIASTRWPRATREAYLAAERNAERKSEYIDGNILAIAGESRAHDVIAGNTSATLNRQLTASPCDV